MYRTVCRRHLGNFPYELWQRVQNSICRWRKIITHSFTPCDVQCGGIDAAPAARTVHVYALEFLGRDGSDWNFRLRCSRGTYVRALVRDIARAVGAVATTTMIRRVQSGGFDIKNAVTLDFLEKLVNNGTDIKEFLKSPDHGLGDIPVVCLDDKSAALYQNGGFILVGGASGLRRVYSGDVFIGIGRIDDTGMLRPKRTI